RMASKIGRTLRLFLAYYREAFMRADATGATATVAIKAERLIAGRKSGSAKMTHQAGCWILLAILFTIPVDMVNGKEVDDGLSATNACQPPFPVVRQNLYFKTNPFGAIDYFSFSIRTLAASPIKAERRSLPTAEVFCCQRQNPLTHGACSCCRLGAIATGANSFAVTRLRAISLPVPLLTVQATLIRERYSELLTAGEAVFRDVNGISLGAMLAIRSRRADSRTKPCARITRDE